MNDILKNKDEYFGYMVMILFHSKSLFGNVITIQSEKDDELELFCSNGLTRVQLKRYDSGINVNIKGRDYEYTMNVKDLYVSKSMKTIKIKLS